MNRIMVAAALILASCNREEQPRAPTADESDRLNDAEEMLDNMANEEGPATAAADPSNRSD